MDLPLWGDNGSKGLGCRGRMQAVIERHVENVKKGSPFLDDIVERLVVLRGLEDWMISALLDAAVEDWDARVHDFIDQCKYAELQAGRRERSEAHIDSETPF